MQMGQIQGQGCMPVTIMLMQERVHGIVYNLVLNILGSQQIMVGDNPFSALGDFRHPIIVSYILAGSF
jgi:hypothetical protein